MIAGEIHRRSIRAARGCDLPQCGQYRAWPRMLLPHCPQRQSGDGTDFDSLSAGDCDFGMFAPFRLIRSKRGFGHPGRIGHIIGNRPGHCNRKLRIVFPVANIPHQTNPESRGAFYAFGQHGSEVLNQVRPQESYN